VTSERAIVKAILAYLNRLPHCVARKRWGGGMGVAGDPDIDCCLLGRSVQLEVKRPGEQPTALQIRRLEEWRRAGAEVGVVHDVAEVRVLLEKNSLLARTLSENSAYIVGEQAVPQASARRNR
jgi:hypothetical protein